VGFAPSKDLANLEAAADLNDEEPIIQEQRRTGRRPAGEMEICAADLRTVT
jgi:hypothetical protein